MFLQAVCEETVCVLFISGASASFLVWDGCMFAAVSRKITCQASWKLRPFFRCALKQQVSPFPHPSLRLIWDWKGLLSWLRPRLQLSSQHRDGIRWTGPEHQTHVKHKSPPSLHLVTTTSSGVVPRQSKSGFV